MGMHVMKVYEARLPQNAKGVPCSSPAEAVTIVKSLEVDDDSCSHLGQLVQCQKLPQGLPRARGASNDDLLVPSCSAMARRALHHESPEHSQGAGIHKGWLQQMFPGDRLTAMHTLW